eukprot:6718961-Pyramimonas_sp.AAC.1
MAMLPKGDEPAGQSERAREPGQLRPLAMKNTGVKIIAPAANRMFKPPVKHCPSSEALHLGGSSWTTLSRSTHAVANAALFQLPKISNHAF